MKQLIMTLSQALIQRQWQLVTAESCTGGGLAYYLTNLPGSSSWFERGFVTYSNLSKQESLGVKRSTIEQAGAVSRAVACEMAQGALQHSHAQVSIAITGIAGPLGGSLEKPVGTVWLAWMAEKQQPQASVYQLNGNRQTIRKQAIQLALENLLFLVKQ